MQHLADPLDLEIMGYYMGFCCFFSCFVFVSLKPLTLIEPMHVGMDILSDLKSTICYLLFRKKPKQKNKVTLEAGDLLRTEFRIKAQDLTGHVPSACFISPHREAEMMFSKAPHGC